MSFYERIFENSGLIREHTKEEKRNNIYLFRNSFLAILLTYKFTHTSHMYVTTGILSLGIFLFTFVIKGTIAYIYYAISMPIIIFVVTVYIAINVRIKQKGIDGIETWLCEKFQNLWLLDGRVISYKEWQTIKKDNEWTYRVLRSDECNHKCYDITYVLANILRNPDIKIVKSKFFFKTDVIPPNTESKAATTAIAKNAEYVYGITGTFIPTKAPTIHPITIAIIIILFSP